MNLKETEIGIMSFSSWLEKIYSSFHYRIFFVVIMYRSYCAQSVIHDLESNIFASSQSVHIMGDYLALKFEGTNSLVFRW